MKQALKYGTRDAELNIEIICALFLREFGIDPETTMKMDRARREIYLGVMEEMKEMEASLIAGKLAKAFSGK